MSLNLPDEMADSFPYPPNDLDPGIFPKLKGPIGLIYLSILPVAIFPKFGWIAILPALAIFGPRVWETYKSRWRDATIRFLDSEDQIVVSKEEQVLKIVDRETLERLIIEEEKVIIFHRDRGVPARWQIDRVWYSEDDWEKLVERFRKYKMENNPLP